MRRKETALLPSLVQAEAARTGDAPACAPCTTALGEAALVAAPEQTAPRKQRPWLIVGLPTVPRAGADYLTPTLAALAGEVGGSGPHDTDPLRDRVQIWVMSTSSAGHAPFERLRAAYASARAFRFLAPPASEVADPPGEGRDAGTVNKPGYKVRRQTRHFLLLLRAAAGASDYFMTMEDDFVACAGLLPTLYSLLRKAHRYEENWAAIRVSYGLAGVILRGDDLGAVARYFGARVAKRPPDHLMVEWMARESDEARAYLGGRRNLAFRYNVLDHIGATSSLRSTTSPTYPRCYEALGEPTLFAVEAFSERACPHDDVWPCVPDPSASATTFGGNGSEVAARQNLALRAAPVGYRAPRAAPRRHGVDTSSLPRGRRG